MAFVEAQGIHNALTNEQVKSTAQAAVIGSIALPAVSYTLNHQKHPELYDLFGLAGLSISGLFLGMFLLAPIIHQVKKPFLKSEEVTDK